mgnify:FL=1
MKKIMLLLLCCELLISCHNEYGKTMYLSGVFKLQTESGIISPDDSVTLKLTYCEYDAFSRWFLFRQPETFVHKYVFGDGAFSLNLHNVIDSQDVEFIASSEFGDTVEYQSDVICFSPKKTSYKNQNIILYPRKHVFHPTLYNITQNKPVLELTESPYSTKNNPSYMTVYNIDEGDSLLFTINHDVITEIRLEQARNEQVDIICRPPYTSSVYFVLPAVERDSSIMGYNLDIYYTTLHYGTFQYDQMITVSLKEKAAPSN